MTFVSKLQEAAQNLPAPVKALAAAFTLAATGCAPTHYRARAAVHYEYRYEASWGTVPAPRTVYVPRQGGYQRSAPRYPQYPTNNAPRATNTTQANPRATSTAQSNPRQTTTANPRATNTTGVETNQTQTANPTIYNCAPGATCHFGNAAANNGTVQKSRPATPRNQRRLAMP